MGVPEFGIPVFIDEPAGADRRAEMLVGGVPVHRGSLRQGGWFALEGSAGRSVLEGVPAAYWPDGSIKWLHLCGPVDLAGGKRNDFVLKRSAQACVEGLTVRQIQSVNAGGQTLQIAGGLLDVEVNADAQRILAIRRGGKRMLVNPGLSVELVLIDPAGERAKCWLCFEDVEVQAVVQTANRVVVRLAGVFRAGGGQQVGELVLFLEIFRESPEIRLQPVFIFLGNPQEQLVACLSLTVHTSFGGDSCRYGLAGEGGRAYWDKVYPIAGGPRWPHARLVQLGSSFYRIEKRTFSQSAWVKAAEGMRSEGWCQLAGADLAVTAGMRYFWQEYPRSLSIDADQGQITFGLVPSEAAPLDLRRYSPTIYGMVVYETGRGPFPQTHGARGIAKASELFLHFGAPAEDEAEARGAAFAHPCRIRAAGEYFAASDVVGKVAPFGADPPHAVDEEITRVADFLLAQREARGWYGLMDFGDVMESYDPLRDRWAFDLGGFAWINSEALPDYGLWVNALRGGKRQWLEAAIEMSRHNRDVDTYHRGILKGLGTRHHVNHWGDLDKEWRVSMPLARRLHYYLTADPWTAEVILETVKVYQSYSRTAPAVPSMSSALAGIYAKWEMSGDPEDGQAVRNMLKAYAAAVRPDGQFTSLLQVDLATGQGHPVGDRTERDNSFFLYVFGGQHVLVELAELLDDKAMSDAIVRHAEYLIAGADTRDGHLQFKARRFPHYSMLVFLAHAWRASQRKEFRNAIKKALEQTRIHFEDLQIYGRFETPTIAVPINHQGSCQGVNKLGCELGAMLHLGPYGLAAMRES